MAHNSDCCRLHRNRMAGCRSRSQLNERMHNLSRERSGLHESCPCGALHECSARSRTSNCLWKSSRRSAIIAARVVFASMRAAACRMYFLSGTVLLIVSSISAMVARAVTSGTICCSVTSLFVHRCWLRFYAGPSPLYLSLLALPLQLADLALHFKDELYMGAYCKTFASLISCVAVVVFMARSTA